MSLETDLLIDRRRLRRKLSLWRVLAFIILTIALAVIFNLTSDDKGWQKQFDHVARIEVSGFIGNQKANLKLFEDIAKSKARAVIVRINSPGGVTTGGEALHNGLRALSAKKPTVAFIDGVGASAAYMAAIGTDHIVARRSSLVGSIGILVQYPNFTKLLDNVGVTVEEVKSSPLKASPNGVTPTSPEAFEAMSALVQDTYGWFKGLVKERRGFDDAGLEKVADGRIFTGAQALELKLIDEVGDEQTARQWLKTKHDIATDIPLVEWTKPSNSFLPSFARAALSQLAQAVGLGDFASALHAEDPGALDGLVSVWHPRLQN